MPSLHSALEPLEAAERVWLECEAEWNDYTVHSYEELQKEVQALEQRISKRRLFIEGQVRLFFILVLRGRTRLLTLVPLSLPLSSSIDIQ